MLSSSIFYLENEKYKIGKLNSILRQEVARGNIQSQEVGKKSGKASC